MGEGVAQAMTREQPSSQPALLTGPAHLELEVLARRSHQGGTAQPQHHQHGQEKAAGQDPARQPRAPAPPGRHAQWPGWGPETIPPATTPPHHQGPATHRDMQLRKSLSCSSSDPALALLLVLTRILAFLTLSKGPAGSETHHLSVASRPSPRGHSSHGEGKGDQDLVQWSMES